MSFIKELWMFLRARKKFWLLPIFIMMALLGALIDGCSQCHGNSPAGPSHAAHVVGIHYDTLYTGTTGRMTTGNTAANSHGLATASTTINCNVCHNATVTSSANDRNSNCSAANCHDTAPRLKGNAAIASRVSHVNGTP